MFPRRPGRLRHAELTRLPDMSRDIAARRNRARDAAGRSHAGLRPCRLLRQPRAYFAAFSLREAIVGGRVIGMLRTGRGRIGRLARHVLNRTGGRAGAPACSRSWASGAAFAPAIAGGNGRKSRPLPPFIVCPRTAGTDKKLQDDGNERT